MYMDYVQALRKRRRQSSAGSEPSTDLELIASLLPTPNTNPTQPPTSAPSAEEEEEDQDTEDILRETTLLLLRLLYAEARTAAERTEEELALLRAAPRAPVVPSAEAGAAADPRTARARAEDSMWKVDAPRQAGGPDGKGPLLDAQGKVSLRATLSMLSQPTDHSVRACAAFAAVHDSALVCGGGSRARAGAGVPA